VRDAIIARRGATLTLVATSRAVRVFKTYGAEGRAIEDGCAGAAFAAACRCSRSFFRRFGEVWAIEHGIERRQEAHVEAAKADGCAPFVLLVTPRAESKRRRDLSSPAAVFS
jgi:hypothetical protein